MEHTCGFPFLQYFPGKKFNQIRETVLELQEERGTDRPILIIKQRVYKFRSIFTFNLAFLFPKPLSETLLTPTDI